VKKRRAKATGPGEGNKPKSFHPNAGKKKATVPERPSKRTKDPFAVKAEACVKSGGKKMWGGVAKTGVRTMGKGNEHPTNRKAITATS